VEGNSPLQLFKGKTHLPFYPFSLRTCQPFVNTISLGVLPHSVNSYQIKCLRNERQDVRRSLKDETHGALVPEVWGAMWEVRSLHIYEVPSVLVVISDTLREYIPLDMVKLKDYGDNDIINIWIPLPKQILKEMVFDDWSQMPELNTELALTFLDIFRESVRRVVTDA